MDVFCYDYGTENEFIAKDERLPDAFLLTDLFSGFLCCLSSWLKHSRPQFTIQLREKTIREKSEVLKAGESKANKAITIIKRIKNKNGRQPLPPSQNQPEMFSGH